MKRAYVPPSGNRNAKLAIVAEQPGLQEAQANPPRPLIGPAGRGFDECLLLTKTSRHELYLTNVIKDLDASLKHYISINPRGKSTVHPEGMQYIHELADELKSLNPNCVLALGNVALFALTNRVGITKWHGSVLESTIVSGLKIIPTFHPATFIPPKFNFINKPLICDDLLRAKEESKFHEIHRIARNIIVRPSFNDSVATLDHCYELGCRGQTIGIDIEVINGELDCISFAWSAVNSMSIPFRDQHGDYFTPDQELEIMLLIAKVIQEPKITKIGANFIFDLQFLFRKYGIRPRGTIHCTQIAQKISFPDLRAGLDAVTTMHTDVPYYKQDGKQWMKMQTGTWEQWWNYNGMDAIIPVEANPKQMEILRKQSNIETYERQRKLIEPLIYMSEHGIRVDVQGMVDYKEKQQEKLEQLVDDLNNEVGYEINYNSPPQMMKYFYEECGIKPYFNRKSHKMTSDVDALKRIYRQNRKGSQAARLMLDIRSLSKRISTYLNIGKVDKDGRYRSSYKPVGAETGRLSSGETIFGTGGNQQNWPHNLLRFFLFDEGYIGYSLDLSQIENRIVAYVGGVISQIKAFEQGIDLHRLSASIVFGKPYDEISAEDGSSSLGDGRQSERYWGKKCKFKHCQVLSLSGWIGISEACKTGCKIAQWATNGEISFVQPSSWFTDVYSGDCYTIKNQRIYQQATPEHKMPLFYNGYIVDKQISNYPRSGKYGAPLSGTLNSGQSIPDPLMRLIVAFQADGCWSHNGIAFKLQKERKIKRLKAILELASIKYNDNPSGIYISAKHDLCKFMALMIGRDKLFGSWLLNLDQTSLSAFIDELPHWDGHIERNKKNYFTTNKNNAEWVQTIAHLCNKASNINIQDNSKTSAFGNKILYRVNIRDKVAPSTHAIRRKVSQVNNETIYCPTVPSGYFLCRERGKISVTGNSNHATNYNVGYKTFALKNEMSETEAKRILTLIHRGYPQIQGGYHIVIQNMLKKNRTVTNLFNRKRLFLGPIIPSYPNVPKGACQATYREAYAQLPQSTCADKINEQGIEYIYYNQGLFKFLEMLTQVHDSVVFQIPLAVPWIEHARMISLIKQSLELPLEWHGTKFATPCDVAIGLNMGKKEMIEYKSKDVPDDIDKFADLLEVTYGKLQKGQS